MSWNNRARAARAWLFPQYGEGGGLCVDSDHADHARAQLRSGEASGGPIPPLASRLGAGLAFVVALLAWGALVLLVEGGR